jgi:hypothetical protein
VAAESTGKQRRCITGPAIDCATRRGKCTFSRRGDKREVRPLSWRHGKVPRAHGRRRRLRRWRAARRGRRRRRRRRRPRRQRRIRRGRLGVKPRRALRRAELQADAAAGVGRGHGAARPLRRRLVHVRAAAQQQRRRRALQQNGAAAARARAHPHLRRPRRDQVARAVGGQRHVRARAGARRAADGGRARPGPTRAAARAAGRAVQPHVQVRRRVDAVPDDGWSRGVGKQVGDAERSSGHFGSGLRFHRGASRSHRHCWETSAAPRRPHAIK